jgi:hypothetical protein
MSQQKLVQKKSTTAAVDEAAEDQKWFLANEAALQSQYLYKYIAIKNQKVLFCADTPEEMIAKAKEAGVYLNRVLCSYMQKGKGPSPINV